MHRFLTKDYLSGLMFIAFGLVALYFGQKLALGTPVRMGPGYVPRMLSIIMMTLGSVIGLSALFATADERERKRYWVPVAALSAVWVLLPVLTGILSGLAGLGTAFGAAFLRLPDTLVVDLAILSLASAVLGRRGVVPDDLVEAPKWKPITMVTIGIVAFALLFERTGMLPALIVLVLISSWGGEEFKLTEVIGNIVVLAILCTLVFKVGLGMNISIVQGVW